MTEKFYPMLGDLYLIDQNVKAKKAAFNHYFTEAIEHKDKDLRIVQFGADININVLSVQAFEEFEKAVPKYIDRFHQTDLPAGNLSPGSLVTVKTDEKWKKKRKEIASAIGISQCSKYIKMMLETTDAQFNKVSANQNIDFTLEIKEVTLSIIINVFFGHNIFDKLGDIRYINPFTGEVSHMGFVKLFIVLLADELVAWMSPKGKLFPFLQRWKLAEPYKTNKVNVDHLTGILREYLETSDDKDSIYHELLKTGQFTKEECLMDCMNMMLAGFDTVAHFLTSILHYLKKSPDKLDKLKKELDTIGLFDVENKSEQDLMQAYMECDYLNFVMKEVLRIDTPVMQSSLYEVFESTEICGVKLDKGQLVGIDIVFCHYNPDQYHRPTEFLPERFDPENELFFRPGGGKQARHPKSFIPFTFGARNCVGQTLARLESKVVLARLLEKIDYDLTEDIMNNPDAKFNAFESMHLEGKILESRY